MTFIDKLNSASERTNSIVCMGCDPELSKIPIEGRMVVYDKLTEKYADHFKADDYNTLTTFYGSILWEAKRRECMPAAIKPNIAFWAQYNDGLGALEDLLKEQPLWGATERDIQVILDAKRGDIGKTSGAYAREVFEIYNADAVTVAPYMGSDSVEPFIKKAAEKKRGVYVLCRTSNSGSADFQNLDVSGHNNMPLYMAVARKIVEWGEEYPGTIGAVVGATSLPEFETITKYFIDQKEPPALLIPGVGAQGGSAKEVTSVLKDVGYPLRRCRINSSSGINFAYEKAKRTDWAAAAVDEIRKLNEEIGPIEG